MMPTDPSNESREPANVQEGVSLEQYAAVHAAVSEGFELDRVLDHEGLSYEHWAAADEAWAEQMMDDAATDELELSQRYDLFFVARQNLFRRSIKPLDDDLQAWLDFVRVWSAMEDPLAACADLGLGNSDVLRLSRHWAIRIAEEEDIKQQALAIMKQSPGEIPSIEVAPAYLVAPVGGAVARQDEAPDSEPGAEPLPPLMVPLPEAGQVPSQPSAQHLPNETQIGYVDAEPRPEPQRFVTAAFVLKPDEPAVPFQESEDADEGGAPVLDPNVMPFKKGVPFVAPPKDEDEE